MSESRRSAAALGLLVAIGGGLLGWRDWRRYGVKFPDAHRGPDDRARLMAILGILSGAMFGIVIAAQWVPNFVFGACEL